MDEMGELVKTNSKTRDSDLFRVQLHFLYSVRGTQPFPLAMLVRLWVDLPFPCRGPLGTPA